LLAFSGTKAVERLLTHVLVLAILAVLWAIVLLPPLLRSRTGRANDSIGDFNHRLDLLGRTNGAVGSPAVASSPRRRALKRRRDVTRVLLSAAGLTGVLALASNMALMWALHVVVDLALIGFFALWTWARSVQAERALKVRRIPARAARDLALRRAASS
jgi:hypothetical protein